MNPGGVGESTATRSASPSEDEILESSQEMRDELISSPTPKRKRKPISPRNVITANTHKRPRLGGDAGPVASGSRSKYRSDDGMSGHYLFCRWPILMDFRRCSRVGPRKAYETAWNALKL